MCGIAGIAGRPGTLPDPAALASLRADQWVPAGGVSCSVIWTTRSITAALSGGLRPGRLASRLSPSTPRAK